MRIPTHLVRSALAGPSRSPAASTNSLRRLKSTLPPSPVVDLPSSIEPQVTTLPNKIRVITEPAPGHINTVALTIDAGTRYESPRTSGVTHLLDKLAWQSNSKYTADEMALNTAQLGNSLYNIGARDSFFYGASTFPSQLPLAISLLSSNVLHPLLLPEEVENAKLAALYETQVMWSSAKQVLPEIVLQTAYKDNTLGMPSALSEEQAPLLGEKELRGYLQDWFRPERMVITGLGMPHEELVELVTEHFEAIKPSASPVLPTPGMERTAQPAARGKTYATVSDATGPVHSEYDALSGLTARYTGGEQFIEKSDEQFTHLAVAFEAPKVSDQDVYVTAVMQQLLLGGSSFSQGGPGKGMYSRLNQNVLNRNYWVDLCQSFHEVFNDSGLFGIRMAVEPGQASRAATILCGQLHALTGPMMAGITEEQLSRAKNMLKSFLVMGTEARMIAAEDLGRQFLTQGFKESAMLMCSKVDAVTKEDVYRVATRIFRPHSRKTPLNAGIGSEEPTIVGIGKNVEGLGDVRSVLRKWDLGGRA